MERTSISVDPFPVPVSEALRLRIPRWSFGHAKIEFRQELLQLPLLLRQGRCANTLLGGRPSLCVDPLLPDELDPVLFPS